MHRVCKCLGVGVVLGIHLHVAPSLRPIVPILDYHVDRHMTATVLAEGVYYVIGRHIAFLGLRISEQIAGHEGHFAGKVTVASYDIVHTMPLYKVVVKFLCRLHLHGECTA